MEGILVPRAVQRRISPRIDIAIVNAALPVCLRDHRRRAVPARVLEVRAVVCDVDLGAVVAIPVILGLVRGQRFVFMHVADQRPVLPHLDPHAVADEDIVVHVRVARDTAVRRRRGRRGHRRCRRAVV